ncbi:hypothetical protein EW026_g3464 [Hermanssonia centrifuga]|uniref:Uncharacterized protein n=1 Tax=Hermanssonia centrifuga TaxID=98765 RepID=A0A4S4KPQ6_9APHY|nr:hypothetical protein EW026_g3464 [Hermanssonia centrifuga]
MDSTTTPAAPIAKTEPPSEQKLPSEIDILEERITLLTDLNGRVEKLRQTPSLLRVQSGSTLSTPLLREGFEQLKELSEKVKSEPTQDALNTAKESEAKDRSDLGFNNRRRNLKRARPPSPESPQPFRAFQPKATSLFPPDLPQVALQLDELIEYIKESNKSNSYRLHIWSPSAHSNDGKLPSPVIVRFTIRDVVIVYLTLGCVTPNSTIIVEGATAFGPREKVEAGTFAVRLSCVPKAIATAGKTIAVKAPGTLSASHGASANHSIDVGKL